MSRFVLIHGAWHGGWCWHKVTPFLTERGHSVATPDLPLMEGLDAYVAVTVAALEAEAHPAILVGHSMGGAVVSQAAEQAPDKVERLVFVSGFALQDGESINTMARTNIASGLRDNMMPAKGGGIVVKPEVIRDCFYHDCGDEDVAFAMERLRPQNPAVFDSALVLTPQRYGKVDKQYIECVEDQAIHIRVQREMARRTGCTLVNSMSTSHSPFFSAPAQLAAYLATVGIKDARRP
jgi:pimeloyl-ACP methyl ester carboxylesterase